MMMMNSTEVWFFSLGAFLDVGLFRYLVFALMLLLYVVIVGANLLLILVICVNRSLHEPMYMFLLSLFVNELYGSTGLFPQILVQILAQVHTVPVPLCFLQIFVIYTYANVEFCSLAVMSYDRYLAICWPLQYSARMRPSRTAALIGLSWLYPLVGVGVLVALSSSLQLCGNLIHKVYCDNYSVVKLACSDATVNNAYGMVYTAVTVGVVLSIVYSYARILKVCSSSGAQSRQKALSTCSPHLASLINFSCGCFFEIIQNRFDMKHLPGVLRVGLSLYWLVCQPLFNPALYGASLTKVRLLCKKLLAGKMFNT